MVKRKKKKNIFPPISKTDLYFKTHKLLGAYFPIYLADHLSLYCYINKITISKIIVNQVKKFTNKLDTPENLISQIVKNLKQNWEITCVNARNKKKENWQTFTDITDRWEDYKNEIRTGLKKRNISPIHIEKIIEDIEDSLR